MTRREELTNFLNSIYIPVNKLESLANLCDIVKENDYRPIEAKDSDTMRTDCLIIKTTGKGNRETYQGYQVTRIDIANVSDAMATIAIFNPDSNRFEPQRIKRTNIRINILE